MVAWAAYLGVFFFPRDLPYSTLTTGRIGLREGRRFWALLAVFPWQSWLTAESGPTCLWAGFGFWECLRR